jgi:hypothetical protein
MDRHLNDREIWGELLDGDLGASFAIYETLKHATKRKED